MNVYLLESPAFAEEVCGNAAATCTNSKDYTKSLKTAMESGHYSVLEHISFTFKIEGLSRAALAQLTRHRIASYSVMSQRYVDLGNPDMVVPQSIRDSEFESEVEKLMTDVMDLYHRMCEAGIPKEDARYVSPQMIPTSLVLTMNGRELFHFFSLRCCNRAQWEIRELADQMLSICKRIAPVIFENAGPGCMRGECPEKHPCGNPGNKKDRQT